jgi:hypothetical protein
MIILWSLLRRRRRWPRRVCRWHILLRRRRNHLHFPMRPAAARAVLVVEAVSRTTSSSPSHAASSAIGINDNVGVEASVAAVNDDYDGHGCCHMSVFCRQIASYGHTMHCPRRVCANASVPIWWNYGRMSRVGQVDSFGRVVGECLAMNVCVLPF